MPGRVSRSGEVRTSASHAIRIDWVDADPGWRIGITIAPGKHSQSSEGFRWERALATDLDALVAQGTSTLVGLLELDAMARLGIPTLLSDGRERGIDVIHAPIRDVSCPSIQEARALVATLLERKAQGIVVHCNGGLGRSGVVVGCLLRALGLPAVDVLRRLKAARGHRCPETDEQRDFIERLVLLRAPRMHLVEERLSIEAGERVRTEDLAEAPTAPLRHVGGKESAALRELFMDFVKLLLELGTNAGRRQLVVLFGRLAVRLGDA